MKKGIIGNGKHDGIKRDVAYSAILFTAITFVFLGLLGNVNISEVLAQQQNITALPGFELNNPNATYANTNMRTFQLTFDSLVVNDDHDPITSGEWVMDAYVNNLILDLFPGSISVNNGETINFTAGNSAKLTVPDDNAGFIRIATVGWENDVGFEPIPVFFKLLDTRVPFYIYNELVQQATVPLVAGPNDPNGFVAIEYDKAENFGVGSHSVCSERNTAATNPSIFEGDCDYRINFTIEEISQQ